MVSFTGWVALATFVAQNTAAALLMRYAKTRMEPYNSAVAVLLQEVALKLPISVVLFAVECGGFGQMVQKIRRDFSERPLEWAQLSVPALLYLVTNISVYVGYDNLEAALGMVMYQSKIVFTAIFSVTLLNKKISVNQWCGGGAPARALSPGRRHGGGRSLAAAAEKNRVVGMGAFLLAAVCTSFASVYFEKMIKSDSKPSLWLRNLQLAMYSGVIAVAGLLINDYDEIARQGPLHGFGFWTWCAVLNNALGRLLVAVIIKYADNILRSFAQGLAIVSGAVGSYLLFDFQITAQFMLGVVLVIGAVFLYGAQASTPTELCEQLALSCLASVAPSRGDSALSDASADAPLKPAAYASVQPTEPHTADEVEEP
ncbi:hypothetical protein EMIHUDRAFT_75222 [Emiliania huxleyi CCMP1516]|uniref:Nucleotide-sugar transporter n=2 Tax=Emiliania huxleyi TaxID=2903 RepID=A0A0D3JA06_EMIH1|nr:hypothetical protein EMIHUDRAFT_75222 [Emiliania huxleyi CCMP1516]EOD20341.1 hypothetical protein EMIHUDRAFT_75222 [Emiliania huxleyi CCMP1516]|eukprot:XP_005772770.1 hypothetical protein EMIHUDRAFT_75222 [Emiliania huxleyi CCMP1516]